MRSTLLKIALSTTMVLSACTGAALADDDHEHLDVEVGQQAGVLGWPELPDQPAVLDPVDPGNPFGFQGWSGEDPGWATLEMPEDGWEPLASGAEIWVEVLSLDSGLRMLDPDNGLADINVGDTWLLGGDSFDTHPIWLVDSTTPGFDPSQTIYSGTFRLLDQGTTGYSSSGVHTLSVFVPEPASAALLALAALALRRR